MDFGAIAIMVKTRRYIRKFRQAGADSLQRSINPSDHGIKNDFVFRKLVRQGILVEEKNEKYYLDENRYARIKKLKLSVVAILVSLILLTLVIFYLIYSK
jgi:hypothetical protein